MLSEAVEQRVEGDFCPVNPLIEDNVRGTLAKPSCLLTSRRLQPGNARPPGLSLSNNVRYLLYATTSGIHQILSTPLVYAMHILVLVDPEPCSSL